MGKICLAISGGVDSTFAGSLLISKGFEVQGLFLQLFDDSKPDEAVSACEELNIKLHILDLREEFKTKVREYFANEYLSGRTPNPCIVCNRDIKFGLMLEYAINQGFDYLATGHYANKVKRDSRFTFRKMNHKQDQSYFLSLLSQEQISKAMFPLGNLEKSKVRELAAQKELVQAHKKDSLEICFIESDYRSYFKNQNITVPKGNFVDKSGLVLGEHDGIINYTVGQRRGLGVSYKEPLFVKEINPKTNEILLVTKKDLYEDKLIVKDINFLGIENIPDDLICTVFNRSQSKGEKVKVALKDDFVEATYIENRSISSPGQTAVFCDDDGYLLFSGVIT
ncbi:MAG: tRNA 2-thiouridine(34) synthase MnmA [Clostridia bacterium]|nr:tRNA 2-thiouridine(34) synthase MnmA [Clostridia bacterium]